MKSICNVKGKSDSGMETFKIVPYKSNRVNLMSSFDFSVLSTKSPHGVLINTGNSVFIEAKC